MDIRVACLNLKGWPATQVRKFLRKRRGKRRCRERQGLSAVKRFVFGNGDLRILVMQQFNPGQAACVLDYYRGFIEPVSLGSGDGDSLCLNRSLRQFLAAAQRKDAIAKGAKVPTVVKAAEVFFVALVHDEVHALSGFAHRDQVPGAVGVADTIGQPGAAPFCWNSLGKAVAAVRRVVPEVQAPAAVVFVRSFVIEQRFVFARLEECIGLAATTGAVVRRRVVASGIAAGQHQRKRQCKAACNQFLLRHGKSPFPLFLFGFEPFWVRFIVA